MNVVAMALADFTPACLQAGYTPLSSVKIRGICE